MKIEFQSTPSAWRETVSLLFFSVCVPISIHSLRMEGDQIFHSVYNIVQDFNPLPPHGGRRRCSKSATSSSRFQSTPSAWRETTRRPYTRTHRQEISIHSLRMEGDFLFHNGVSNVFYFNPLPPHGGRPGISFILFTILSFQSTPSAWRET